MAVARIVAVQSRNDAGMRTLDADAEDLLRLAIKEMGADRDRATRVANTIASMDFSPTIRAHHVAEAIQYQHRHAANWVDDFEEAKA